MNVRTRFIQHFCKAEHIVGVTSLRPLLAGEHTAEVISRMKMLTHTVTSNSDAAMIYHRFPEIAAASLQSRLPSKSAIRLKPITFGIWVLACIPVSLSSCLNKGCNTV